MTTTSDTGSGTHTGSGTETGQRAQPPIRWPRPDRTTISAIALWLSGLAVALLVPALIVPPGSRTAETWKIWTAFSVTVVGALLTLAGPVYHLRRKHDTAVLILGAVPAVALVVGGVIFSATMISRQG